LSEIHAIPAKKLREFGEKLVSGGGTLACARQLMRDDNAQKKAPPLGKTAVDEPAPDVSMDGGNIDPLMSEGDISSDNDSVEVALPEPAAKVSPAKKTTAQPPARVLEEPPHKTVDLNSVQVVIRNYIDKISKSDAGYEFEYKTDAAYEIWSLLLSELAES
jgi:hypothetical protein